MTTCRFSSDSVRNEVGLEIGLVFANVFNTVWIPNRYAITTFTGFLNQVRVQTGALAGRWHVAQSFTMKPFTWAVIKIVGQTLVMTLTLDNGDEVARTFVRDPSLEDSDVVDTRETVQPNVVDDFPVAPIMGKIRPVFNAHVPVAVTLQGMDVLNSLGAGRACQLISQEYDGTHVASPIIGEAQQLRTVIGKIFAVMVSLGDGTSSMWSTTVTAAVERPGYVVLLQEDRAIRMHIVYNNQPSVDVLFTQLAR